MSHLNKILLYLQLKISKLEVAQEFRRIHKLPNKPAITINLQPTPVTPILQKYPLQTP